MAFLFQSPRSGKFVSDISFLFSFDKEIALFQSPRSGKFVSDMKELFKVFRGEDMFQSPRSGKFVSDSQEWDGWISFQDGVSIP